MSTDNRSLEKKVRECFHNLFIPGRECKNPATWKSRGAGNPTDHWTWCDEHVTKDEQFRERLK